MPGAIATLAIPGWRLPIPGTQALPKKPNYDFEKRRKEQDRKKKKDAKREERLLRKRGEGEPEGDAAAEDTAPATDQTE